METVIHSLDQIQYSAPARRLARRWPRQGAPLRWGPGGHNRRSAAGPGGGGGPPSSARSSLPEGEAAWLASLRPWAMSLAGRLGVNDSDRDDVVQEAFTRVAVEWGAFVAPDELPARTARRRWIADLVVQSARRIRSKAERTRARVPYRLEQAANVVGTASHEGPIAARELLRALEGATTAERWRMWLAHEVDEVEVAEIARQEGRQVATVYNQLRLARRDLAAALGRELATGSGPLVPRGGSGRRKPRA